MKFFVPILTSGGLAAVSASAFAALYSAFGKYDVVHIHAEGPAFFSWLPKMFGKRVVVTIHGVDWQREKWQSGFGSKFIRQGEKNAVKYADEIMSVCVLMLMQLRLPNTIGLFIEVVCGAVVYVAVNIAMKNTLIFEIIEKVKNKISHQS